MNLDELNLSHRTRRVLKEAGFNTIEQVEQASNETLLAIPSFGVNSLAEAREIGKRITSMLQQQKGTTDATA